MTCPDIMELEQFARNALDEAQRVIIESHVADCAQCAQELNDLNENLRLADSLKRRGLVDEAVPESIGPYRILREIGRGGMGRVFEAQQESPRRTVALKVIRPTLVSRAMLSRFRHEAQALGRLQHPGIAQIYEAGTHPQPYVVMELVRGPTLLKYAAAHNLDRRQRLDLLASICDAVHHAHQRGVIHRDLKPDNILVDEAGSESQAVAQPKILDFGVARIVDPDNQNTTLHTSAGQIVGTVAYMSPEQASAKPDELDTRSDVYALGVIGYELVSGQLPYTLNRSSVAESIRTIVQDDPQPLSKHERSLRGDVTTIIGKALEKDKQRRYQSAAELATDIRRFLRDEPISAHPPSTLYQLRKFARRNKGLVAGIAAAFLILVVGLIGTSYQMVQAQRARVQADKSAVAAQREAAKQAAVNQFLQDLLGSANPHHLSIDDRAKGRNVTLLEALDQASRKVDAGSLKSQPDIEAAVRKTLAVSYQQLGELEPAEHHVQAWMALVKRLHGDGPSAELADATIKLAVLRESQGKMAEAESLTAQALDLSTRALGRENEQVAYCLNAMGILKADQGKLDEAESLFKQSMEMRRKLGGERTYEMATSLNSLALVVQNRGDLAQAEALYRQSLAIREALFGNDDHPDIAAALDNLAIVIRDRENFSEAEPIFRRALTMRRKLLGEDHAEVATTMNNLASLLQSARRYDEAETMYRDTIAIQRKALGEIHPSLARTINNLATLLQDRGKTAEAETYFRQSLEMRKKLLPEDHPMLSRGMSNLGAILRELGKFKEAESLARQAVASSARRMGADHPDTASYRAQLGACLIAQKRFDEAHEELIQAAKVFELRLANKEPRAISCIRRLADLEEQLNRPEEATRWREKLLRAGVSPQPNTRPSTQPSTQSTR